MQDMAVAQCVRQSPHYDPIYTVHSKSLGYLTAAQVFIEKMINMTDFLSESYGR
jgi:hypothetical protein